MKSSAKSKLASVLMAGAMMAAVAVPASASALYTPENTRSDFEIVQDAANHAAVKAETISGNAKEMINEDSRNLNADRMNWLNGDTNSNLSGLNVRRNVLNRLEGSQNRDPLFGVKSLVYQALL